MEKLLNPNYVFNKKVAQALHFGAPVVALESTVITHGLPRPGNLDLAQELESIVVEESCVPATIALLDGKIHIGLTDDELTSLSKFDKVRKISRRDIGLAAARKENGGTTVAGTLFIAHHAGISVFATGGIGGVHRNAPFDISADLPELSRTPMVVVCAGAKAILDLPATVEYLETSGVPIVGYQTEEFPAFYSKESGLPVTVSVQSVEEIADIARMQWQLGIKSAVLVVVPPPAESALPYDHVQSVVEQALEELKLRQITGPAVTPFLLQKVAELSEGSSLASNLALLKNNARVAAQIARVLSQIQGQKKIRKI